MPPRKPEPDRDVHWPVAIQRTMIVVLFIGFWVMMSYAPFVNNKDGFLIGIPVLIVTAAVAIDAWDDAWNHYCTRYNEAVKAWDEYHAAVAAEAQRRREQGEQEQRARERAAHERQAQIDKLNAEIAALTAEARRLGLPD